MMLLKFSVKAALWRSPCSMMRYSAKLTAEGLNERKYEHVRHILKKENIYIYIYIYIYRHTCMSPV